MQDLIDLKITLCEVPIEIKMGIINVDEPEHILAGEKPFSEIEAGKGHVYKWGRQLIILPDTPKVLSETPAIEDEKVLEKENNSVSRNHQYIAYNLNKAVSDFNRRQESLALALKPIGRHTIKLKYLR